MNNNELIKLLNRASACSSSLLWLEKRDSKQMYYDCERGDWLLWLLAILDADSIKLKKAEALCANTVRHLMKDERSRNVIDVILNFCDGKASARELDVAKNQAYAAYAAAYATAYASAAYAAYAAAYAGGDNAAYAVYAAYAANAANAAANAHAAGHSGGAMRRVALREMASLVRSRIHTLEVLRAAASQWNSG